MMTWNRHVLLERLPEAQAEFKKKEELCIAVEKASLAGIVKKTKSGYPAYYGNHRLQKGVHL